MTLITRTLQTTPAHTFNAPADQEPVAQSAQASSLLQSANPAAAAARQPELALLHPSSTALEAALQSASVATRAASPTPAPAMPQISPQQLVGRLSMFASTNGFGYSMGQQANIKDMVMRYAQNYGSLDFSRNDTLMTDFAQRFQIPGANGEGATPPNWKQQLSTQLLKAIAGETTLQETAQAMASKPMAYLSGASIQATRTQVIADLTQALKYSFPVTGEHSRYLPALAEQLAPIVRPDPIIYRQDLSSEVANGARQWIELATGMQLASQLGVEPQCLSSAQLLELVQTAQVEETKIALASDQAGAETASMPIAQYKLALLARAHGIDLSQEGSADKLKAVIEKAYADEIQTISALEKLGQQPPSRKQMAIDTLRAAGKDPFERVARVNAGKYAEQAKPKYLYEEYMGGAGIRFPAFSLFGMPNINDKFNDSFNAFTENASSGLRELLQAQFSRRFGNTALNNDTRFKIQTPVLNYSITKPSLSGAAGIDLGQPNPVAQTVDTGNIDSSLTYIVEDTAAGANDPRYYWFSAQNALQGLQPVDLKGQSLNQWISANQDKLFDSELVKTTVHNAGRRGTVELSASSGNFLGDGGLKSALQSAGDSYAKKLEQFRSTAYAETTDEKMLDKVLEDFLFYGTYKAIKEGKVFEAVVSGIGDLCTVLPYAGKGVKAALLAAKMARAAVAVGKATATMEKGIDMVEQVQDAASRALSAFQKLEALQAYGDIEYQPKPFQPVNTQGWQPWEQARNH